jgi:Flp pilus assembly protein TadB
VAVLLAALAALVAAGSGRPAARLSAGVTSRWPQPPKGRAVAGTGTRSPRAGASAGLRGPFAASVALGGALWLLVGGPLGLLLAVVAAVVLPRWLGRLEPARVRQRRQRLVRDLPVAADLLAACLAAGSAPEPALDAVARAVGGPVEEVFGSVAVALRLGVDPAVAWGRYRQEPDVAPLARAVGRALAGGTPLAVAVARCGNDLRARRRLAGDAAAEAVGVKATGPLGLCFLPAFVLLGVAPTVIGLAATVFG